MPNLPFRPLPPCPPPPCCPFGRRRTDPSASTGSTRTMRSVPPSLFSGPSGVRPSLPGAGPVANLSQSLSKYPNQTIAVWLNLRPPRRWDASKVTGSPRRSWIGGFPSINSQKSSEDVRNQRNRRTTQTINRNRRAFCTPVSEVFRTSCTRNCVVGEKCGGSPVLRRKRPPFVEYQAFFRPPPPPPSDPPIPRNSFTARAVPPPCPPRMPPPPATALHPGAGLPAAAVAVGPVAP